MITEYRKSSDTNSNSLQRLQEIIDMIPDQLRAIPHLEFNISPTPGKWSKKQIVGHLIDSATNNHHRFVRAQFDLKPTILYDQEKWNSHGYYEQMPDEHIISFWKLYNQHIIELIKRIPPELMERECTMEDGSTRSIAWLFDDYVRHMEHHLGQIVRE